jgi:hypothetical protein
MSKATLLAETLAEGLHSLAQPLTATQWHLEIATMPSSSRERQQSEVAEALVSLELVVAHLDFLRDIIRPFRTRTEFKTESVREALLSAQEMQQEILQHEGVHVAYGEGSAEGLVTAPQGFLQRISLCLFDLLRPAAPLSVRFDIRESAEAITLVAELGCREVQNAQPATIHGSSVLRSYVEILGGDLSIAEDFSLICIKLPRLFSSI